MENEKQEKLKKILKKAVDIKKNSDLAIAREFVDLDEKIESEFDELEEKIEIINDSLKKKLESELVLEIDREELKGEKGIKGDKGERGEKGEKGDTRIVEKVIEKREIIKEQPIIYKNITNEIKEVAKYEERDQIVTKINSGKDKDIKIEAKQITGLPEFSREVVREVGSVGHIETPLKAGNNVTITTDGTGAKVINANQDLDSVDSIQFDINATPLPNAEGLLQWNATDGTLDLGMDGGEITQQIGQELFTKVRNQSGSTILNGKAVYFSGRLGNRPLISLAKSDAESTSRVAGITTEDITSPDDGFITTAGYVRGIKTNYTGSGIWGTTWAEGDSLYVSKTDAGVLTNVEPDSPHHSDIVGSVGVVHSSLGSILVSLDRHKTLAELSDVDGTPLTTTGQIPTWHNDTQVFDFDKNINDIELALTTTSGNSYMEYTTIGDNITQVNYWTDSGKGTKLFTKDITYSGSNPTQVVVTDEISSRILTSTIAYSGDIITSVTKVLS